MKFYNLIIMFAILLGSTFTYSATVPTVSQVESTIASGDYTKARKQLGEVLAVNPDSYVANRYMFEIIKIENGRDNKPSVEYKIYEDRLLQITKATEQRIISEKRAEFKKSLFGTVLGILLGCLVLVGSYFLYKFVCNYRQTKLKEKEFEDWSNKINVELQDLDILLTNATALSLSFYQKDLLEALIDDNTDSLGRVLEFDVNRDDIDRHIDNAKDFLRKECRMTVT